MLKGVSAIISMVIVIFISVLAVGIVMLVAMPTINKAKEAAVLNEAKQNMHQIDDLIREVASEGLTSLRSLTFKSSDGQYKVNALTNTMEFTYTVKYGTVQPGTFIQDGNLMISAGTNAKASIYNLSSPMPANEKSQIVLENENIRVALHYNSSATAANPEKLNTSKIVQLFNFISTGVNVTPSDSMITLDDFPDTSVGSGYSYLVRSGDHLASADAIVVVNTTLTYYEILYSLPSGADFLIVKIQNAYYQ
jgi:type II secretory pathway pseudopilin PulG